MKYAIAILLALAIAIGCTEANQITPGVRAAVVAFIMTDNEADANAYRRAANLAARTERDKKLVRDLNDYQDTVDRRTRLESFARMTGVTPPKEIEDLQESERARHHAIIVDLGGRL